MLAGVDEEHVGDQRRRSPLRLMFSGDVVG